MPVPAEPRFTPLCGAALPQEGADLYHPGLTMSELMSGEESKEHLAGSLEVPSMHLPPTPAFGEGPGCWFSSSRQQEPTQTSYVPPMPLQGHQPAETTPAVVGLPSACPCSHLGTVTVVALVPLPVFNQEQV